MPTFTPASGIVERACIYGMFSAAKDQNQRSNHLHRNWRGHAARVQYYFESGSLSLQQFKQALYASAALKIILELSVVTAVLITPLVFVAMFLWGIFWIRHGWFRQLQEVPTIDAVAPINMWGWHMAVRLYAKLGIPMNDLDLTQMPPELRTALASFRKS